jgi:transposase
MKRHVKDNGTVMPVSEKKGRKPLLSAIVVEDLLGYLSQRPTALLDEMRWVLYDEHEIQISMQAISSCLKRNNWSRKKAQLRSDV